MIYYFRQCQGTVYMHCLLFAHHFKLLLFLEVCEVKRWCIVLLTIMIELVFVSIWCASVCCVRLFIWLVVKFVHWESFVVNNNSFIRFKIPLLTSMSFIHFHFCCISWLKHHLSSPRPHAFPGEMQNTATLLWVYSMKLWNLNPTGTKKLTRNTLIKLTSTFCHMS
jgi:hypothetical protein